MTGRYDHKKAGPFGPKRREVLDRLVDEALDWIAEDGAPEYALPELFAEALTVVLERRGKLEPQQQKSCDRMCFECHAPASGRICKACGGRTMTLVRMLKPEET